jgi:multiple sugar transport system substrate-binding protein
VKINQGQTTGAQAATDLQQIMVKYATSQGFTVH